MAGAVVLPRAPRQAGGHRLSRDPHREFLRRSRLAPPPLDLAPAPARLLRAGRLAGRRLWIWDEAPSGGNKIRKLEWLLADTLARRRGGIILLGPTGSNWVAVAAAAARRLGLAARVVWFPSPTPPYAIRNRERTLATADEVREVGSVAAIPRACLSLLARHPDHDLYPPGGTGVRSSLGHVEAALELERRVAAGELPVPGWIFAAAGTGGTVAGLAAGLELTRLPTRIAAVRVTDGALMNHPVLSTLVHRILVRLARAGVPTPRRLSPGRIQLRHAWFGPGYAKPTPEAEEAVRRAAGEEGLELETTYTGKTLAAALADLDRHDRPILFWNSFAP